MFGVTANNKMSAVAGLVIGATLCHLIGIPLTGTPIQVHLFVSHYILSTIRWTFVLY